MSKFLTFADVCFKTRELLLAALTEIGYQTVEEGTNLSLYGYQNDRRKETAEIVIRRQHVGASSNDIGFKLTETGYVPIISEFDQSYTQDGNFITNLRVAYNTQVAVKAQARLRGAILREVQGRTAIIRVRY
jgi:hypothetical protein